MANLVAQRLKNRKFPFFETVTSKVSNVPRYEKWEANGMKIIDIFGENVWRKCRTKLPMSISLNYKVQNLEMFLVLFQNTLTQGIFLTFLRPGT